MLNINEITNTELATNECGGLLEVCAALKKKRNKNLVISESQPGHQLVLIYSIFSAFPLARVIYRKC